MKKLPKTFIILEIIPTHSNAKVGFIAQVQALKINDKKIIDRLDLRIDDDLIENKDLLKMISYDKEMFTYTKDKGEIISKLKSFIGRSRLLIIDNFYTLDYLSKINNKKESIFHYLNMEISDDIFDKIIKKYQIEPSNHLVDMLYEALMFEEK